MVEVATTKKPIFVVGCTNSGTTCLYAALSGHRDVEGLGREIHWYGLAPNYEGRLNRLFALWPCFGGNHVRKASKDEYDQGPLWGPIVKTMIELAYRRLRNKGQTHGIGDRMLVKEPKFCLRVHWLRGLWPDCKILGIVRNPWSVAEGIRRRLWAMGDTALRVDIPTACSQWIAANTIMMNEGSESRGDFMVVRYEDMICADEYPGRGAEWWNHVLDFLELEREVYLLPNSHEKSRFERGKDDESLGRLEPWEIEYIRVAAGGLLERFGYTEDREWPEGATKEKMAARQHKD